MHKVSFDFDSTLSEKSVQKLVKSLKDIGLFDIWIVTSRLTNERAFDPSWNDDLYKIAKELNIPETQIIFCSFSPKYEWFLNNEDFLFHIDDDWEEIQEINIHTKVRGIHLC